MVTIATILIAGVLGLANAQQPKIDELKMTTYQAVLVKKGAQWTATSTEAQALREKHLAYIDGLMRNGDVVIAGPFSGDADLRGVYIVNGPRERATALAQGDPGVQAGRWAFEILDWMGPEGWFQKPPDPSNTEKIYFGFLVTGENTSAVTKEQQQELMRGHLDYMDGQSKQGRLVLAGPLIKAGVRRGFIAYRVGSMEEAMDLASADPMVRAGRMKPELYEWTIPAGVLR